MKSTLTLITIIGACFVVSCASDYQKIDRGVAGTLRSTITDRDVDVNVERGVVTLEGKVNTEADRQRIDMLARRTAGVVAVKNNLEVEFPSPADYGPIPGSTTIRTAPPTAVVTEPPSAVMTETPAAVVVPSPTGTTPTAIIIPNTPRVRIQPVTTADVAAANRIAEQLASDPVATAEFENVTISVNGGVATVRGVVGTQFKREALLASLQRVTGISTVYDQLQVR